jgi:hypothetical protein
MGVASTIVVAGAVVAAVVVPGTSNACFPINGGKGFTITSAITAYPSCSGPIVYLYPGVRRCLVYTAHNPLNVPITVSSLSIAGVTLTTQPRDPALPVCTVAELDLSMASFSGSLVVPGLGTNSVAEPITLVNSGANQDNCEAATFNFVYSGAGSYTDTTTTFLNSAPNPSKNGRMVTFDAAVTPTGSPPSSPTGTVGFYLCRAANCASTTLLGSTSLGKDGQASYSTSTLAVGTDLVEAIFKSPTTDFAGSTSAVVSQVVQPALYATTTDLDTAPNPIALGSQSTLTATVSGPSGTGTPSGTVNFYSGSSGALHTLLGTSSLHANGKATFTVTGLPSGADNLYAVYGGDTNFESSTSATVAELVVAPPAPCAGSFQFSFTGSPGSPVIEGTDQADFIYAFGGNYIVNGLGGNDCIWAGDGANLLTDSNGNDVVLGGNGLDAVILGDGGDTVRLGNGDGDAITAGNGDNSVTAGNGAHDIVTVGNGTDSVVVGTGPYDAVTLGAGSDAVTVSPDGSHDTINGGNGNETIYLGPGTYNSYFGAPRRTNTCHVPLPPSSWKGSVASYYHDSIVNCTVVSP